MVAQEEQKGPSVADETKSAVSGEVKKRAVNVVKRKVKTKLGLAAAGSAVPGLGTAAGFALGVALELGTKISDKLKLGIFKNKNVINSILSAGLMVGGLAVAGPIGAVAVGVGAVTVTGTLSASSVGVVVSFSEAFFVGTNLLAEKMAIALAVIFIGFIVFTALVLVIINSGAFVVPPSVGSELTPVEPTEGCPSGWPIAFGSITQGPDGPRTHEGYEALDISGVAGTPITATHPGSVNFVQTVDIGTYGLHVHVLSECEGNIFFSRYAHMSTVNVVNGQSILPGDVLGIRGNTGTSTGPHVHYEFRYLTGRAGPAPNNPPYMSPFYIPKVVPYGCGTAGVGPGLCNILVP